ARQPRRRRDENAGRHAAPRRLSRGRTRRARLLHRGFHEGPPLTLRTGRMVTRLSSPAVGSRRHSASVKGTPMIKSILVAATGGDTDSATLAAALAVARLFQAHLDVLHVRLDAVTAAVAMTIDAGSGA